MKNVCLITAKTNLNLKSVEYSNHTLPLVNLSYQRIPISSVNGKMKLVARHHVVRIKSGKDARNHARTKKFVSSQIQLLDAPNSSKIDQCAFVSPDLF